MRSLPIHRRLVIAYKAGQGDLSLGRRRARDRPVYVWYGGRYGYRKYYNLVRKFLWQITLGTIGWLAGRLTGLVGSLTHQVRYVGYKRETRTGEAGQGV